MLHLTFVVSAKADAVVLSVDTTSAVINFDGVPAPATRACVLRYVALCVSLTPSLLASSTTLHALQHTAQNRNS